MNRRDALKGLTAAALTPAFVGIAAAQTAQDGTLGTLILANAPLRQSPELLFQAYRKSFSVDNRVSGFVTGTLRNATFERQLEMLQNLGKLKWAQENGVYIVSSDAGEIPAALPLPSDASAHKVPKGPSSQPYQVVGIRYERTKEGNILNPTGIIEITTQRGIEV